MEKMNQSAPEELGDTPPGKIERRPPSGELLVPTRLIEAAAQEMAAAARPGAVAPFERPALLELLAAVEAAAQGLPELEAQSARLAVALELLQRTRLTR